MLRSKEEFITVTSTNTFFEGGFGGCGLLALPCQFQQIDFAIENLSESITGGGERMIETRVEERMIGTSVRERILETRLGERMIDTCVG